METSHNSPYNDNKDRNGLSSDQNDQTKGDTTATPKEKANTGDWNEQRDSTRTDDEGYEGNSNDNTGGAGSSGSAATNS